MLSNSSSLTAVSPITLGTITFALALIPVVFLSMTAFVKISVIFSILRNALGGGSIPSAAISSILAFALTCHIMSPIFTAALDGWQSATTAQPEPTTVKKQNRADALRDQEVSRLLSAAKSASAPFEEFLKTHSTGRERRFFAGLRQEKEPTESLFSLVPAFLISELTRAFSFGVLLLLPFLIIDIVVTNVLIALGMAMVNPVTFSFPLKLLLFVLADGWYVLSESLILSYR